MKKLILIFSFISLFSCNDSKKVNNSNLITTTDEVNKKNNELSEKDLDLIIFKSTTLSNDYIDNAREGDCNSYYEPNERTIFMGSYYREGRWNYLNKTYNVDEAVLGYDNPKFISKKYSIKLDNTMFIYLYSDILCALKDNNYEVAKPLIARASSIYNSNISSYYDVEDLKIINNLLEGISNLGNLITE